MNGATIAAYAAPFVALISAVFVYIKGRKDSKLSNQAQVSSDQQDFIAILQEDNKIIRQEFAQLKAQFLKLEREVNRLYRKYGENGTTPPEGIPVIPPPPETPKGV